MSDNILHQWARHTINVKKIRQAIFDEADFKEGDRVKDVGCGTGDLLAEIHTTHGNRLEYTGIEPDEKLRSEAEKKYREKGIRFKRAFAHHLPSIQDYYSHVICMMSFHHFPKQDWRICLAELKRVVMPGGKIIIVDFGNPSGIIGKLLWLINPCKSLSRGLMNTIKMESQRMGLKLIKEKQQFGYITHLIFTK